MIEIAAKILITIIMVYFALGSAGLVEAKKKGQREGKLDYYGNPIEIKDE